MREVERIERITDLIKEIWESSPNLRYTQLHDSLYHDYSSCNKDAGKEYFYDKYETEEGVVFTKTLTGIDLFHLEDNRFEEFLREYVRKMRSGVKAETAHRFSDTLYKNARKRYEPNRDGIDEL